MNIIEKELKNKLIPFWLGLKDNKHGGFFGYVNNDLKVKKKSEKSLISQARHLYTFSIWYQYFKKEELKIAARHAYDFLLEAFLDKKNGGFYWLVKYNKKALNKLKHIYGQAFAIYGLSEYGRVFNDKKAIELAFEIFKLIDRHAYQEGCCYREQFCRKWIEKNETLVAPLNSRFIYTTNTLLHLLEAYTNLYWVKQDIVLRKRIVEIVNIFKEKLYNEKKGSFYLYFDESKKIVKESQSFGHDIEACWLLDQTIKILKLDDEKLNKMVLNVAESVYKNGMTERGLITENNGENINERIWWVQAEAMVGFYNHYQKTNKIEFLHAVNELYKYLKEEIIDERKNGEWFWGVDRYAKPLNKYGMAEEWKSSYHNGRAFIELLKRGYKL